MLLYIYCKTEIFAGDIFTYFYCLTENAKLNLALKSEIKYELINEKFKNAKINSSYH